MTRGDACLAHESEERRRWQCHPSTGELERRQRYLSRPPGLSEEISYKKIARPHGIEVEQRAP